MVSLSRRLRDPRVDVTSSLLGATETTKMRTERKTRNKGEETAKTHLPQLCQMYLERLRIILEPQRRHGIQYILPPDRLAFLHVAFLSGLRGDETDELGDAFLDAFFGVFGDFGGGGDGLFHDTGDVGDLRCFFSLVSDIGPRVERLTGRKRSCSLYSPTSCSVIGAGGGASGGVVSWVVLVPSSD